MCNGTVRSQQSAKVENGVQSAMDVNSTASIIKKKNSNIEEIRTPIQ
jgi:hypothetical protein